MSMSGEKRILIDNHNGHEIEKSKLCPSFHSFYFVTSSYCACRIRMQVFLLSKV